MSASDSILCTDKRKNNKGRLPKPKTTPARKCCIICKEVKPVGEFHRLKSNADGHRGACKNCWNAQRYRWVKKHHEHVKGKKREEYLKNREKYLAYYRSDKRRARWFEWKLMHDFGITVEDFDSFLEKQGGVCAVCGKASGEAKGHVKKHRLHVDHDHKTGKVRGLLCHNCNVGIGNFNDDTDLMLSAIAYLEMRRLPKRTKDDSGQTECDVELLPLFRDGGLGS